MRMQTEAIHAIHVNLFAPAEFASAPDPVPSLVAEVGRLIELRDQLFIQRDATHRAVPAAQEADRRALAESFRDGGKDVDPTENEDRAKREKEQAQKRLTGCIAALDAAQADLRAALKKHSAAFEDAASSRLMAAEGRYSELLSELRTITRELDVSASLVKLARARGATLEVAGWSGRAHARRALSELEEASLYIGMDGAPLAPFEDLDVDVERDVA